MVFLQDWELTKQSVVLKHEYGDKEWTYDRVFDEECTSHDVYNEIVHPIVEQSIHGYNGKYDIS